MRMNAPVLSPEEIKRIHKDSIRILEEVGVKVPSEKALGILEAGGAKVDHDKQVGISLRRWSMQHLRLHLRNSCLVQETENMTCGFRRQEQC